MLVMLTRSHQRRRNPPSKVSLGEEATQRQHRVQSDARGEVNTPTAGAEGLNPDEETSACELSPESTCH